jgi:hypothetical protein
MDEIDRAMERHGRHIFLLGQQAARLRQEQQVRGEAGWVGGEGAGGVWIGVEVNGLVESRGCATIARMMDISLLVMPAVGPPMQRCSPSSSGVRRLPSQLNVGGDRWLSARTAEGPEWFIDGALISYGETGSPAL